MAQLGFSLDRRAHHAIVNEISTTDWRIPMRKHLEMGETTIERAGAPHGTKGAARVDFGFSWFWTYGHLLPAAALTTAAIASAQTGGPGWLTVGLGAIAIWAFAGFLVTRFVVRMNELGPLPSPDFATGTAHVLDLGCGSGRTSIIRNGQYAHEDRRPPGEEGLANALQLLRHLNPWRPNRVMAASMIWVRCSAVIRFGLGRVPVPLFGVGWPSVRLVSLSSVCLAKVICSRCLPIYPTGEYTYAPLSNAD